MVGLESWETGSRLDYEATAGTIGHFLAMSSDVALNHTHGQVLSEEEGGIDISNHPLRASDHG